MRGFTVGGLELSTRVQLFKSVYFTEARIPWRNNIIDVTSRLDRWPATMRSPFCRSTRRTVLLNGEDLSRYSNKIESVGLRICPYCRYLIEKVTSTNVRTTNISRSLPHKMAENGW